MRKCGTFDFSLKDFVKFAFQEGKEASARVVFGRSSSSPSSATVSIRDQVVMPSRKSKKNEKGGNHVLSQKQDLGSSPASSSGLRHCFRCGSTEHMKNSCPLPAKKPKVSGAKHQQQHPGSPPASSPELRQCYGCGSADHLKNCCPNLGSSSQKPAKKPKVSGAKHQQQHPDSSPASSPELKQCYGCGSVDHLWQMCPNNPQESPQQQKDQDTTPKKAMKRKKQGARESKLSDFLVMIRDEASKPESDSVEKKAEPKGANAAASELRKEEKDGLEKEEEANGNGRSKEQTKQSPLGGLIFMCNRYTKQDCFKYMVMGLPENKRHMVMNIQPGFPLFIYDYDLKVLYGAYKAASPGGMSLEPFAFNGSFPAQVRFEVHRDCLPLPEAVLQKAIPENYETTMRFKMELSVEQVKKLVEVFKPVPPQLQPGVPMVGTSLHHHPRGPFDFQPPPPLAPRPALFSQMLPPPGPYPPQPRPGFQPIFAAPPMPIMPPAPLMRPYPPPQFLPNVQQQPPSSQILYRGPPPNQTQKMPEKKLLPMHAANAASALSEYNQRQQQQLASDPLSLPVSSRYTFDGPTVFPPHKRGG